MSEIAELIFAKACEIAVNMEYTSKEAKELNPKTVNKTSFQNNSKSSDGAINSGK